MESWEARNAAMRKKVIFLGAIVFLVVVLLITLISCFSIVNTSEVAVITTFGKVTGTANTGLHLKAPWQSYHRIDLSERTLTQKYSTATKDSQSVSQDVTIRWVVDPDKVEMLYERYLGDHDNRLIMSTLPEAIKQGAASFSISEYITRRDALSDAMDGFIHQKLDGTGIDVTYVGISNIDLPAGYESAIADRQVAEEKKKTAKIEQETAKTQAETNRILAESYSKPEFFKIEWLKAWERSGGKMPTTLVIGENGAETVFPIGSDK